MAMSILRHIQRLIGFKDCCMAEAEVAMQCTFSLTAWLGWWLSNTSVTCASKPFTLSACLATINHKARQKSHTTALNGVCDPKSQDDSLNPTLHQNLLLHQAKEHIWSQNNTTVCNMLLTWASARITFRNANSVHHATNHLIPPITFHDGLIFVRALSEFAWL